MLQEQKPKKPPRKKPKPSAMTRPPKRNKKKKKPPPKQTQIISSIVNHHQQNHQYQHPPPNQFNIEANIKLEEAQIFSTIMPNSRQNNHLQHTQHHIPQHINRSNQDYQVIAAHDMYTVCENSSAYESSEDTGVGGLSESELIAHDGKYALYMIGVNQRLIFIFRNTIR